MRYLIDPHARPPALVHIVEDRAEAEAVAQKYATQTGHALLIAIGPSPGDAPILPLVPEVPRVRTEVATIERQLEELQLGADEWELLGAKLNNARDRARSGTV